MDEKVRNYIEFGVSSIWVVDAKSREGWDCSDGRWLAAERFEVANSPIYLSLPDLFAKIDADGAE
jgi:Uma2 family endonuclease